jgi:hypothetical protein
LGSYADFKSKLQEEESEEFKFRRGERKKLPTQRAEVRVRSKPSSNSLSGKFKLQAASINRRN